MALLDKNKAMLLYNCMIMCSFSRYQNPKSNQKYNCKYNFKPIK